MRSFLIIPVVVAVVAVTSSPAIRESLIEALENFRGGGPRTPGHPLPSNDGLLLRKRRKAAREDPVKSLNDDAISKANADSLRE